MSAGSIGLLVAGLIVSAASIVGLVFNRALTYANNNRGPERLRSFSLTGPRDPSRGTPRVVIVLGLLLFLVAGVACIAAAFDHHLVANSHHNGAQVFSVGVRRPGSAL